MIHGATLRGVFLSRYNLEWILHHPPRHCSAALCMAVGYEEVSARTLSRRMLMSSLGFPPPLFLFRSCNCYEDSEAIGLIGGKY